MKKINTELGILYYFDLSEDQSVLLDSDKKPICMFYLKETISKLEKIKDITEIADIVVFKPFEWSLDTPLTNRLGKHFFAFREE